MSVEKIYFNRQLIHPSYTTDERVGLSSETGSMIFNSTTNKMEYFNGSSWIEL
jgi:hypothetical protein